MRIHIHVGTSFFLTHSCHVHLSFPVRTFQSSFDKRRHLLHRCVTSQHFEHALNLRVDLDPVQLPLEGGEVCSLDSLLFELLRRLVVRPETGAETLSPVSSGGHVRGCIVLKSGEEHSLGHGCNPREQFVFDPDCARVFAVERDDVADARDVITRDGVHEDLAQRLLQVLETQLAAAVFVAVVDLLVKDFAARRQHAVPLQVLDGADC